MTTKTDSAQEAAQWQMETIMHMVKRLEHCRECDGEDCELTDAEILAGLSLSECEVTQDDRDEYHNEDGARNAIMEDPLCILVREDWHAPGERSDDEEYELLLSTGGPSARIIGSLGGYKEPITAALQYQDWGRSWVTLYTSYERDEALLAYAQQFCFR